MTGRRLLQNLFATFVTCPCDYVSAGMRLTILTVVSFFFGENQVCCLQNYWNKLRPQKMISWQPSVIIWNVSRHLRRDRILS